MADSAKYTPLPVVNEPTLVPPPADAPDMREALSKLVGGKSPEGFWIYRDKDGSPLFGIGRVGAGKDKSFYPIAWQEGGNWVLKAWPAPRPLYGLELGLTRRSSWSRAKNRQTLRRKSSLIRWSLHRLAGLTLRKNLTGNRLPVVRS
jgi:hypothetical protein